MTIGKNGEFVALDNYEQKSKIIRFSQSAKTWVYIAKQTVFPIDNIFILLGKKGAL